MTDDKDIRTFLELSGNVMNVNALTRDWEENFVEAIGRLRIPEMKESFRRGFAKSVCGQLSPQDYERETEWDFDTDEELQEHLLTLWEKFYGDADPRESLISPPQA